MQGMAGTLMLVAGTSIMNDWTTLAYITQAFIAIAFAAQLFGKFCVGAYVYHLMTGNAAFAHGSPRMANPSDNKC
jgi:hypothetical protein